MTDTARTARPHRGAATGSSSASPATRATACSSRATASPPPAPLFGNDLSTLPEFPAEIRAPAGTVAGVSSFQVHISDHDITTPGDAPNVLVAMNPAALHADLDRLEPGGTLIVNTDTFDERNLAKAGYADEPARPTAASPATRSIEVPMTSLTKEAATPLGVKPRDADRSKNFFALGLVSWMYSRPTEPTLEWIEERFAQERRWCATPTGPRSRPATTSARPPSCSTTRYEVQAGQAAAGRVHEHHRQHRAGLGPRRRRPAGASCRSSSAATRSRRPRDILHELSKHKNFGVRTFQAEDEIAAVGSALGAAFAGHLGVTTTSGPGVALKSETISLAVSLELPLLDHRHPARRPVDRPAHQDRGGRPLHRHVRPPRRGAAAGRRRLQPVALLLRRHRGGPHRAQVPHAGDPAVRRLPRQRLPSRGGCPTSTTLPDISVPFATEPNHVDADGTPEFWPYLRDPETLARPWAIPGTPGLMHRIGGIEKEDGTGNISYTPDNHERMVAPAGGQDRRHRQGHPARRGASATRRRRAARRSAGARTWGAIDAAVAAGPARRAARWPGSHLVHLNPFPANLGEVLRRYPKILVPEMNLGQLSRACVRAEFLVDATLGQQGAGRCRSPPASSRTRHPGGAVDDATPIVPVTTKKDWTSDQEVRWCPGCGDYGILARRPAAHARARRAAREHGVRVGHRLLEPLPVLHEHLRHARHPRSGPGHRHRRWPWPGPTSTCG